MLILRLALRNLFRNRWRTALTIGGIAVATSMLTWTTSLILGMEATFVRGATGVELGQIQVAEAAYVDKPNLYHHFAHSEARLDAIDAVPGVNAAAERVVTYGLIGHEVRSQVARIVGVDPVREPRVTLLRRAVVDGRWLSTDPAPYPAARELLLGQTFAQQLGVSVGDQLVLFTQAADGSLGNDLLEVVGILRTGNSIIDRTTAYMQLADVQYDAALEGQVQEIAISVGDLTAAPELAHRVADAVRRVDGAAAASLVVRPWQELIPELAIMLDLYDKSVWITFLVIFVIVALGILNTERMSALERRREFGVLKAIGLAPRQLGWLIMAETVLLSAFGAVLGALGGYGLSEYHATNGLDMRAFSQQATFSMMGVSFSERLYFLVTPGAVLWPLAWTVGVALLCGLWPALSSARLNTTQAISGRTG